MSENFLFEQGQIATITFNRPERRNCLTREVLLELEQLLLRVGDDDTRVLILTGSAFSAGADISGGKNLEDSTERMKSFARDIKGFPRLNARVLETLMRLDALTIAAVNGFAVGGGWGLASATDFVFAAETAEFWYLKSRWGYLFSDYRLKSSPEGWSMVGQGAHERRAPFHCGRAPAPRNGKPSCQPRPANAGDARFCSKVTDITEKSSNSNETRHKWSICRAALVLGGSKMLAPHPS
jgi:1,4-dihydroxy-2-naphthoyl-CoA synthase